MRANKYIASQTGLSRRYVDQLIEANRISANGEQLALGQQLEIGDTIVVNDPLTKYYKFDVAVETQDKRIIVLNKPVGYVCSREGQGSKTVYNLLPNEYWNLKIAGRLDKDSSGLVLLTDDGELLNELTHPKYQKTKIYEVVLNKPLQPLHQQMISDFGIRLDDGNSKFQIEKNEDLLRITMREGRNRQIRRTFEAIGYKIVKLHRTHLGQYSISSVGSSRYELVR